MTIISLYTDTTGQVSVNPRRVKLITTDDLSAITTAGYLNNSASTSYQICTTDVIDAIYDFNTTTGIGTYETFTPTFSNGRITLTEWVNPGNVLLPVTANNLALFNNATGQIYDAGVSPSDISKSRVASVADATINYVPHYADGNGTLSSATGPVTIKGDVSAGLSGTSGGFISYPSTAATGSLSVAATSNNGNTLTTLTNDAMGQASIISIPDPGAASAKVLLDTGSANIITDYQQVIGINGILGQSAGTWTITRSTAGDWFLLKTAAAETSITGFDLTPIIRTTASKGFRLASIDYIYAIGTLALTAHTATLTSTRYTNNAAETLTNIPLTGSLSTATQANLYVTNLAVTTPAFLNTAITKYVFEVTVNAQATSDYNIYGINLHFSRTTG